MALVKVIISGHDRPTLDLNARPGQHYWVRQPSRSIQALTDHISKQTRQKFREYFVGTTLRTIRDAFDAADIACDLNYSPAESGERRCLVERYYRTIDFSDWTDVRKLLVVYENILNDLHDIGQNAAVVIQPRDNHALKEFDALVKVLRRDGFDFEGGHILHRGHIASLPTMQEAATRFDLPALQRQIARLRAHEEDPDLAIGTAKEIVETTCKTILTVRAIPFGENLDITDLVKLARSTLELMPENVPAAAKGAESIKRLLSNLGTVAQALGELRNLYGTGHGKIGTMKGLTARHARLAVGCAATLATFLLETHEARPYSPKEAGNP